MCRRLPLTEIQHRIRRFGDPFERNSHHVLFGATGSGKSYLIRHAILPVYEWDRVVVIDAKGGKDSVWRGWAAPVDKLPESFGDDPHDVEAGRFRLIVDLADLSAAREQVELALAQIRGEGHCVLVLDETRSITEPQQLNLTSAVTSLITTGRSGGITVIAGSQSTSWAIPAVRNQAGMVWVGKMTDEDEAKKLGKIMGDGKLAKQIQQTRDRDWLYSDRHGDGLLARTSVG